MGLKLCITAAWISALACADVAVDETVPDASLLEIKDTGQRAQDSGSKIPDSGLSDTQLVDAQAPHARTKSHKRGIAYNLSSSEDFEALEPGVSWWYNWSPYPSDQTPADVRQRLGMDFIPMMWNGNYQSEDIEAMLEAAPHIEYLLVLNEPNLVDQANMTPQAAAELWPKYEAIARNTGVKIIGPAITWGTFAGYEDPVVWLDAFYATYAAQNDGAEPQIDALAFHWYDYGLNGQLERLTRYGKPFWVTEFANWHGLWTAPDGAEIDTVEKQIAQMTEMVAVCEQRSDVHRYAWFTGRWDDDTRHTSLLAGPGQLTALGEHYLSLPFE